MSAQTKKADSKLGRQAVVIGPSPAERMSAGKALRKKVPRSSHCEWVVAADRPDPIATLRELDRWRLPELLPIRYGRMRQSPFSFFRGSAAAMAWDLSKTPVTGIEVQVCGDCHAANFGGFASPERRLVFDVTDFDETLPAPWEWDIKRLAASIVLASRELGLGGRQCGDAVLTMAQSYREHMRRYAHMRALEVWYSHIGAEVFIKEAKSPAARKRWEQAEAKAQEQTAEHMFPRITKVVKGRTRIVDHPPLVYHPHDSDLVRKHVIQIFQHYRESLPAERQVILDRYHMLDVARKVVGVGSVGTRCTVVLMMADKHDPLLLQCKEALPSVLEPYAGKSLYSNHGERVVTGQRMLQSVSDVFLGWTRDDEGHSYYFRQLRDMRMKIDLEMPKGDWLEYVAICGWTLARAHARTGDAALIAGYLGKNDVFDCALAKFAAAYADQTERDYDQLLKAIRAGQIEAQDSVAA